MAHKARLGRFSDIGSVLAKNGQLSNHRDDLGFFQWPEFPPLTGLLGVSPVPGNLIPQEKVLGKRLLRARFIRCYEEKRRGAGIERETIETAEDGQRFVMTLDCGRPYKKAIGYKTTEPSDTSLSRAEEGKFILQLSKHPNLKTGDTVPIEIEPAT